MPTHMTLHLRLRAATVTLVAAAAVTGAVVAAGPAQAAATMHSPCDKYETAYEQDKAKAAAYYSEYKHSTGAKKQQAYEYYRDYTVQSAADLKKYDSCLHGG